MRAALVLLCVVVTSTEAGTQPCRLDNSVVLTNRTYNGVYYDDGEYFVDNATGLERGCVCLKQTCMRKCCPLGQGYDTRKKLCVTLQQQFNPPVHEGDKVQAGFNVTKQFHVLFNKMNCSRDNNEFRIPVRGSVSGYHLKTDGKLHVTMEYNIPQTLIYGSDKYCVDYFVAQNEGKESKNIQFNGLICFIPKKENNHYALNATCMLVSCVFIVVTVCVYAWLPELRSLPGMVLAAHLLCFLVAFLFMASMQILLLTHNITQVWCTAMTFVIYFATLAAFFWLNVLCYDLWAKFRQVNIINGFTKSKHMTFLLYSAYAFGVPTALTALLAALEFADLPANITLLPHLRRKGCFINGFSKLLYLYTPIMALCVTNLVLFILTARKITQTNKQTQVLKKKDTQRLSLYIKLFIVTGFNWILEVVSSLFPDIPYVWQFTDAYNVLVGVIIFFIFVCKKKILMSIKKRYKRRRGESPSRSHSHTTSTSSRELSRDLPAEHIQMQVNVTPRTSPSHI